MSYEKEAKQRYIARLSDEDLLKELERRERLWEKESPPSGLYRIHWVGGGTSVAAVGMYPNGSTWIAPTNWVKGALKYDDVAKGIDFLTPIKV